MLRRDRIGLVALLGAAVVAVFVWGGEDGGDLRGRKGSQIADSEATADAAGAGRLRNARRRDDRADGGADSAAPGDTDADFDATGGAIAATDSASEGSDTPPAEGVAPIALHALRGARRDPSVSLVGFDPLGPRDLVAWRLKNRQFAIIARGSSDRDGSLHFPDLVAARDGLEIVVTASNGAPGLPGASDPRRWAAREPLAPHARLLTTDEAGYHIRIAPREASGAVLLADAYGVVLARYPVTPSPIDATRAFDIALTATAADTYLFVSHEFSDGRVSEWEVLTLPAFEPADDAFD